MSPLLLAAALAAPSGRLLVVEAGEAAVTCIARDAAGEVVADRLGGAGPWTWHPEPKDTVHCAAAGHEPVDIDPARAGIGQPLLLDLLPARPITLDAGWAGADTWVEWRALGERGTALIARERLPVGDRIVLAAAAGAPRLLRLHPRGSAPVSILVPEGQEPLTLAVPPLRPGGELLVRWPSHAYLPSALAVVGADAKEQGIPPGTAPGFRAASLAPGGYSVVPRYRGGVRGPRIRVLVRAGETTEVFPAAQPEPGAVGVAVVPEVCARGRLPLRLEVHRVSADSAEADPGAVFLETIDQPPCARSLEGLAGGAYQVQLERTGDTAETVAASRVDVVAGRKAEVTLAPSVRVVGRVAFPDDHPAADLLLRFTSGGRSWAARTDLDGRYRAVLGGPGEYTLAVGAAGAAAAASLTRAFEVGEQRQDLRLGDTLLRVRVARADGARLDEAVQLVLTSSTGRRLTAGHVPTEEEAAELKGLEPGEYAITARTASGLTSQAAATARLTPAAPQAEVAIVLERHQGRLAVVDEQGRAVREATVSAGGRPLAVGEAGVFPLGDVPLGEWLNVRAEGYAPVCRILQAGDLPEARVTLVRPTEELILHAPPQLAWESALVRGLPGSNCPVEIHDVGVSLQLQDDGAALSLRLPRGRFELVLGGNTSALVAPGSDVVLTNH
jgi:hypothetical protein